MNVEGCGSKLTKCTTTGSTQRPEKATDIRTKNVVLSTMFTALSVSRELLYEHHINFFLEVCNLILWGICYIMIP